MRLTTITNISVAYHFEGVSWPTAAKGAHVSHLCDAADRLLERVERKRQELGAQQRGRGVAGRFAADMAGLSSAQSAVHLARLNGVQSQLEELLGSLWGGRARHGGAGADAARTGTPRNLRAPALRDPGSGALTVAGRALLKSGGARADATAVGFRCTPTTPRRPISAGEVGILVRLLESATALLRGHFLAAVARSLSPAATHTVARLLDSLWLRGLASKRVAAIVGGVLAVLLAAPPAGSQAAVLWLWRMVLLWLLFVLGVLCRETGIVLPPSHAFTAQHTASTACAAERWVDVDRWSSWAHAELAHGGAYVRVEARLVVELAPFVGALAAEGVAADVMARAAADEPADARCAPAVGIARRMAF